MNKLTNTIVKEEFPHLFILRNDEAFKTELEFVMLLVQDPEKTKAVLRYAVAAERMIYVGFQMDVIDPALELEDDEDDPLENERHGFSDWEKQATKELALAKIGLDKTGFTPEFIDGLKLNGTTLEEIVYELGKEAMLQKQQSSSIAGTSK